MTEHEYSDEYLAELIDRASPPDVLQAHSYYPNAKKESFSKPVLLACSDGNDYWVKAPRADRSNTAAVSRSLVNDHVIGRIGNLIAAPVPTVALVELPHQLVSSEPDLRHMNSGIAHGSQLIQNATDKKRIGDTTVDLPTNRERFARLAFLYGLAQPNDPQIIYKLDGSRTIYSVDHGHFFPGGPNWSRNDLKTPGTAVPDPKICSDYRISSDELAAVVTELRSLTDEQVCKCVALPPDSWGIDRLDRIALARFLITRRDQLQTK